jgi:hypothetical protein
MHDHDCDHGIRRRTARMRAALEREAARLEEGRRRAAEREARRLARSSAPTRLRAPLVLVEQRPECIRACAGEDAPGA